MLTRKGGGGTDMTAGLNHIEENNLNPELVLTFTDGHTPFGEQTPFRNIWCITSESIQAPWGETVFIDVEH